MLMGIPPRATIDIETRSECDLKRCGSWRYSLDKSTEVLCVCFRLPYWDTGRVALWYPSFPPLNIKSSEYDNSTLDDLEGLFDWILNGGLVESHNFWFENGIITNILVPKYGWPRIPPQQCRCSAAKSAAHALPRALGNVAEVLDTDEQKDAAGHALMMKLCKPRKPLKDEIVAWSVKHAGCSVCAGSGKVPGINPDTGRAKGMPCKRCKGKGWKGAVPDMPVLFHESRELLEQLWEYCKQDVLSEESVSLSVPDLDENETQLFILDQVINERGFQLDVEAVDAALGRLDIEMAALNSEIGELTEGYVQKGTQRDRMKEWFEIQGFPIPNTQKDTIELLLDTESEYLTPAVRRGLHLMRELGRSSTSKYQTMKRWMCPDGRVRGSLLFHGASTGRWSGAGVQPHNFVKGKIKDMATLWDMLKYATREEVIAVYDSVMDALSQALRGAITAAPGKKLYVADFASIEARVLLWLAEDEENLNIFRNHEDIYLSMASSIYHRKCTKADKKERDLGKIAVLGLGYQMGADKFADTCAKFKIPIPVDIHCSQCGKQSRKHKRVKSHRFTSADTGEITAVKIVDAYREKFFLVKELWAIQEAAAIEAVQSPGQHIEAGKVTWFCDDRFLYCTLPSGRRIAYPQPEIQEKDMPWGDVRNVLTFTGVNSYTRQWERQTTYGGSIVENLVQSIARDLMADAMTRCEATIYKPVLTVHDEVVSEVGEDEGTVEEFNRLIATVPPWADGLPIEAESWSGTQYRK